MAPPTSLTPVLGLGPRDVTEIQASPSHWDEKTLHAARTCDGWMPTASTRHEGLAEVALNGKQCSNHLLCVILAAVVRI